MRDGGQSVWERKEHQLSRWVYDLTAPVLQREWESKIEFIRHGLIVCSERTGHEASGGG